MKTLVTMVTFGVFPFSKLAIESVRETVKSEYDLFCIVGKPDDFETREYLNKEKISYIAHDKNYGFPYSINDIYDYAWKKNKYDYVVTMGPDTIAYPNTIDALIGVAETTDNEWVCSREFDSRGLVKAFPEAAQWLVGPSCIIHDFSEKPWTWFKGYDAPLEIAPGGLSDVHNMCLYKKSVFEKVGYEDVNYYPAYYEDNDYVRRAVLVGTKSCTVVNSVYFHFWSRTIHQGSGGSTNKFFEANRRYYIGKWGGDFGKEAWNVPFNGLPFSLGGVQVCGDLNIQTRENELSIIDYWRKYGSR